MQDLADCYRDSALFVMPSSGEGFGIVYLEAALFKRSSIAGAHGGAPEVVEAGVTGTLVTHGDVGALKKALLDGLSDLGRLAVMGEAAHSVLLNRFTAKQFSERVAELFDISGSDRA